MTRDWPRESVERIVQSIPLRRFARAEEIAAVAVFLATDKASYMTGEVVDVNGGLLIN